jgi:hypothetical protein
VVCPQSPLLLRELNGQQDSVGDLRDACSRAIRHLLEHEPDLIAVVGGADATLALDTAHTPSGAAEPAWACWNFKLASQLLSESGWRGPTQWRLLAWDAEPEICEEIGRQLASQPDRVGLLVMADGSACRSEKAPGYLDPRAHVFDAALVGALERGDSIPLRGLDAMLAEQLLVQGRVAFHVLGSAFHRTSTPVPRLHYQDDPFGVLYVVATWCGTEPAS